MSKLIHELQRLYFPEAGAWTANVAEGLLTPEVIAKCLAGESTVGISLVSDEGLVRAMVVVFEKPGDWALVANLYQQMQEDLELPAPAISVSGRAGYQLWMSLAECIPEMEARVFLDALRQKYLADLSPSSLRLLPYADAVQVNLVPALYQDTGKWSSFIDPSMGAMFAEESGLDMAPNMDRQADMLAGLKRMKAVDFERALKLLQAESNARLKEDRAAALQESIRQAPIVGQAPPKLLLAKHFNEPKSFLLAVMNDVSASAEHRIEAAKALLPYFNTAAAE